MSYGTQIATRLSEDDVAQLDVLVAQGRFESRADAVRAAVASFLDAERRRRVGEAIAEGYRRLPQTDEELTVAEANVHRLVAEEPW